MSQKRTFLEKLLVRGGKRRNTYPRGGEDNYRGSKSRKRGLDGEIQGEMLEGFTQGGNCDQRKLIMSKKRIEN